MHLAVALRTLLVSKMEIGTALSTPGFVPRGFITRGLFEVAGFPF
jgi:hypothetical protein